VNVQNLTKSVLIALMAASPLVGAETQYPAADFQPEIIKQDAELIAKHAEAAKAAAASAVSQSKTSPAPSVAASTPAVKSEPVAAAPKVEESSNLTLILAVGAAALAGLWLFRKPKTSVPVGASAAPAIVTAPSAGNGETGVARYIKSLPESNGAKETGVARYIKSLPPESPTKALTGVEKYINALPEPKQAPMETGVAKYLKSQGLAA